MFPGTVAPPLPPNARQTATSAALVVVRNSVVRALEKRRSVIADTIECGTFTDSPRQVLSCPSRLRVPKTDIMYSFAESVTKVPSTASMPLPTRGAKASAPESVRVNSIRRPERLVVRGA